LVTENHRKTGVIGNRVRNVDLLRLQYGIKDSALLKKSGAILIVVILLFFAHSAFPHPLFTVATIAIGGAVVMLLVTSPHHVEDQLDSVEWTYYYFLRRSIYHDSRASVYGVNRDDC
jgi:Na+/H+ antiporter NhaD/arsenite permease-like protein